MKKNILLVYPEFPSTYWGMQHALKFVNKKAPMPPLGLLTVASMLPAEYNVRLVDMNVEKLNDHDIIWADMVFLSAMIVQKESFDSVVNICNKLGKPVAAGGPLPSSSYESIPDVDHFIIGESELLIPRFVEDIKKGTAAKIYRDKDKPDIRKSPVPRYELVDVNSYGTLLLQFSRGCPYSCEFCDVIELFGRTPRLKSAEQFLKELDCVYDTGYKGPIFLVDDNFIGHKKEVIKLLKAMKNWQTSKAFPFSFFTSTSINLAAEKELLDLMVECGFYMAFIGIETPDDNTLKSINKKHNLQNDVYESVKIIQARGLEVTAGFILGFDTDSEDIFDRQIDFIQKAGIPMAMIGLLNALPDTKLVKRLEKEGRLLNQAIGNNTSTLGLNFIPLMDKEKIITGYKRVLRTIYSPDKYFERSLLLLSRKPNRSYKGGRIQKGEVKAFFKSLFFQTFSNYGYIYLTYLAKALIINWRNFPLAVNLAIKGDHFFKFTKTILASEELDTKFIRECDKNESEGSISVITELKTGDTFYNQ
jgi:radical SAM superfamily enzyme YgiQ (UPF0313 family)